MILKKWNTKPIEEKINLNSEKVGMIERFKYLRSILQKYSSVEEDVKYRIKCR